MIGVIVVLAAVHLAGASPECALPGKTPKGCVYCYSCRVEEETVTSVEHVTTQVLDLEICRAKYGKSLDEATCVLLGRYGFDVYSTVMKNVTTVTVVGEKCVCDANPVAMDCLDPIDTTVFTLECPANKTFNSYITICRWNLPQADQVYMHVLKQDIEGNPNDGDTGCKDKLIVKKSGWDKDLVTCGSLPGMRPATKIYNSIYRIVPNVYFYTETGIEGCCFRILVCLERRKDMNTMGGMTAAHNNMEDVTIDTCAPPMGNPSTTCCTCPESVTNNPCFKNKLVKNPFIQRLQNLSKSGRTCDGVGEIGFSGLKGCIGAEFFTHGTPPSRLTEEQCMTTRLGMTNMEEEVFMSPQGGSLWCGCNAKTATSSSFCRGDAATRPDANELVKLEELIEGRADADECANSDNSILRKVAVFLRDNNNTIPALVPCPDE